jgi:hypothetical protein
MLIDPGGKQGEIMQEFKSKTKRRKQNAHSGNQQKVFDKGIGFSYKTFHNIFFAEQGSALFLRGLRYIEMGERANHSLFLCNALALLTYAQKKQQPSFSFSGYRLPLYFLLRTAWGKAVSCGKYRQQQWLFRKSGHQICKRFSHRLP